MEAPISGSLGAMSSLLGKLDSLLESQHLFRKPVRKDIELLKEDLTKINTFLQELSNEDDPSLAKKYWMKEVREVSYDIEDYIDRLIYSEAKIGSVGVVPRLKISKLRSTLNRRPKIANQIQGLKARLEDADERHRRYVLGDNTPSSHSYELYGHSITTLHEEASRLLVGIDDAREKLIKLLNDGEKQLKVISIFGIGGIGKTTLVRQLFEDHGGQFGFRAFVRVSRKPDTRSVLRSILSQTRCHRPFDACNVQQLIGCLNEHLQDKRYLIVVDDLWDTTVWDILLHAFSDGTHSSRIITTTAIENVAMTCCDGRSDYVLKMEPINSDDSRKLFFTRVFGSEDKCPQQFKDASYEIIRKCGGVPVAIINIAGLLASQPDKSELWDYVQKSLGFNLSISPTTEGMINVINLGYNGLPHCLKTCLQYVSMYPGNCTIWKDDLVRRWVAEGFISPKEGKDMEAVAESYFEELVYRGMIQPIDINYNHKVLSCTVHNLVLDLLINKAAEDNFITTIDYSQNIKELSNKVRRLFLFFSTAKYAAKLSGVTLSQVRSVAFYGLIKCMPSILEFEFLRVLFLHFSGDYSGHTTFNLTGIRRLFQLRYLKVTCNFSLQLPTHIEGLYLLETLELDAKVTPLPEDIVNLQHILHLRLPSETNLPDEMGRMRSLRTLKCFDLCSNSEDKVRSLEELTNLQELQLICTTVPSDSLDRNLKVLCSILCSFYGLKSLALVPGYPVMGSSTSVVDSSSTSSPPVCLERFKMHPAICIFSRLPVWIRNLGRLCILKIAVTEFLQNDMDSLGGLPGLTVLSLYVWRSTLDRIVFNNGAFPALKCFKFRCGTILGFAFQAVAMPNLRRLKLCFKAHRGENVLMLAGIVHLLKLQEITLRIGVATCAEEYSRRAAESAFKVVIGENRRIPNFKIQYVNWAEDDCVPVRNSIQRTCHIARGILERTSQDDTNKNSDPRMSKFSDMIISSPDLLSSGDNQVKQTQPERTQDGLGRNIAPSWEDVLHSSSGLPTPSIYQSGVQYQQNSEYHPPAGLDNSDLRIQLSAAKRFLLGPEDSIDSPSSNFILRNKGNSGTDARSAHDNRLESSLNPDWTTKTPLTFQSNFQGSEITELFDNGQFEPYSRADTTLTLGQRQQFNIREVSPEWAFSYEITKVIITGDFLCDPLNFCWAVMFGDTEVPAEIVQPGVLRCHTPLNSSGKLRICITSGNREVCSEFKDFEFRKNQSASSFTDLAPSSRSLKSSEELLLLAKFARMLLSGNGSFEVSDGDPQSGQCPKLKMNEDLWERLINELKLGCENPLSMIDQIMEELLKSKLQQWLSVKLKGYDGTASSLSKHEQGIIHLISALGYEWALSSVLSAGVGLNFRDENGWTALHWAAYFGREKMVAALLAAGASATAVTDPTAQDPVCKTAAFLASERGHMGLAGYLSEVSLTSYLASLTIEESDVSKGSAAVEAKRGVKRKRQQKVARLRDEYGMTQEDIDELAAASRSYHQTHALSGQFYDKAAVSIQKKYKGWKGRKHFLNMRRNAVKIQAHVRGYQVRKKYRTIVTTVSVLAKVILRWRRKGHGLRGFRSEQQPMVEPIEEDDDFDDDEAVKIFRRQKVDQAVKEAVSRVLSMVDSTEARMQYRRMLEEFRQATAELGGSHEVTSILDSYLEILGINNFML